MNPNKFQVNDIVIAPTIFNGTGIITNINSNGIFCITVEHNTEEYHFTRIGTSNAGVSTPSLYHIGTKITVKEAQPKRWPWVNVYKDMEGKIFCGTTMFNTKECALEYKVHSNYLHTIHLKPEE